MLGQRQHQGQVVLYVAPTGAGKTLAIQHAMRDSYPGETAGYITPYSALTDEIPTRMRKVRLASEVYSPTRPVHPDTKVLVVPLELAYEDNFQKALKSLVHQQQLKCVVVDEARKWNA